MPYIFFNFFGMDGYVYDERGERHHMPHLHVYCGEEELEFYFDGELHKGNIKALSRRQKKELKKWIRENQGLLVNKWKELNSDGEP